MPKETISKSDEGGLVRLKYSFIYEGKFIEPDDDWLKCIEATSDELLGPYSKAEDNTLSATFGGRKKPAEALKMQIEAKPSEDEAEKSQTEAEAGPSEPAKEKSLETGGETKKEAIKQILLEKTLSSTPEASSRVPDYIVRHASGKKLYEEEKREAHHYAQKLKYPKGALIFNGSREEDFLYCLPDSKEITVYREMGRSFVFPTLEDGLSVLSKDELADSLAYSSLKVRE
jgi:hypothetical protein